VSDSPDISKSPTPPSSDADESRTVTLIQGLQSGSIDAKSISIPDRRQLVAVLLADGYTTVDIAQIMKVSDRSIERDKLAIRQSNAVSRDPKLIPQMVGRLVSEAELSVERIRKATRDKGVPAAVKVDAEHRCYQVVSDLIQSMQRLGYLPTAAQKVEADLVHHVGEVPDFAQLLAETTRLKQIHKHSLPASQEGQSGSLDVVNRLAKLEVEITRASLASEIDDLTSACDSEMTVETAEPELPHAGT
jgi:hypothetical protein